MYSLKFGGTSMGSAKNISEVATILTTIDTDKKKSAVVSAMSGTTDLLIKAGKHAIKGNTKKIDSCLKEIQVKHCEAIEGLIQNPEKKKIALSFIDSELKKLKSFLSAIEIIQEISPQSYDQIVSIGEIFSAFLLASHLEDKGIPTEFVNLASIINTPQRKVGKKFFEEVKTKFSDRILPLLEEKKIPIITGFFGKIPGGIVEAVGRGYSDFTASLVGYSCNAQEIQIWTDVSGILSADPRIVSNTIEIKELSFTEASELANFGAKVIHPQTIWPAVKNNIPVRIKNTMKPNDEGTKISKEGKISNHAFKSITAKTDITVLTMHSFEMSGHGFMGRVFQVFAEYEVSVDVISTSEASVSVTIDKGRKNLPDMIERLERCCKVIVCDDRAILAVIGLEMAGITGLAGKIFTALGDAGVNVRMISQGATELNISAVIEEVDVKKGIKAIHDEFF